ncbi:MAG: adenylate/guanylate cyclase domain-containing protein [Pseudomonadota bacterium]
MATEKPEKIIKRLVDAGELLKAVDTARRITKGMTDQRALHRIQLEEVMALARLSSLEEAQERYDLYGLAEFDNSRARSLYARLKKDFGFASEDRATRKAFLRESRDRYLAIAGDHRLATSRAMRTDFEYNAINAVTLAHMIGEPETVTGLVTGLMSLPPLDSYYSWATRAELLLVQRANPGEVGEALRQARAQSDATPGAIATTLRQLSRIARNKAERRALDALRPGPVLHYSGHMIAPPDASAGRVLADHESELRSRIEAALKSIGPSAVFGSLASGSDILVVEWALRTGCDVRVFIPFQRQAFFEQSIKPAGGDWARRARACMAHPDCRVTYLTRNPPVDGDEHAFWAASVFSMGGAILRAERAMAHPVQLVVWDGKDGNGIAGAAADRNLWPAKLHRQYDVDVSDLGGEVERSPAPSVDVSRVPKALVFGDVKNFSKLLDPQLPDFVHLVMGGARDVFDAVDAAYPGNPQLKNTWGDGIFAVFDSASAAAEFALSLQDRMTALKPALAKAGLPDDLAIRLGLHFGIVYPLEEPVTGLNFFGEAVARAARIEPVTTAGRTFVSEEFAAALALEGRSPAIAEYVGETAAAKRYGRFRLYRIRRK